MAGRAGRSVRDRPCPAAAGLSRPGAGQPASAAASAADGLGVAEVAARRDREVVVERIAVGDAGRDLEVDDVVVADALEVLAQGPEAVAVGHDQHGAAPRRLGQQVGHDGVLPVGDDPGHHVGQALGERAGRRPGTSR